MEVIVCDSAAEASRMAAGRVNAAVRENPRLVLGLATGSTPLALYKEMAAACAAGLPYRGVTTFNLDEYIGLPPDHPQSYRRFMDENLFKQLDIDPARTFVPDGMAPDMEAYCAQYEAAIRDAGGIDIQILGIGSNGHIGFNEPPSPLDSRTRVVRLTEQTIRDNARFFADASEVPREAVSMGVGTILDARCCVLLGFGANKAEAVRQALRGEVSEMCPASALQRHADTVVFLDRAAAAGLG